MRMKGAHEGEEPDSVVEGKRQKVATYASKT